MGFMKGAMPGPGRPKDKPWRDALRRAILRYDDDHKAPGAFWDRLADHVRDEALTGDRGCRAEIVERFDGKVPNLISGDDESPVQVIHTIRRVFVEQPNDKRRRAVEADSVVPLLASETLEGDK